ncbi:hypothetical protein Hanom_Chr13g01231441 [Helianthus anomalus]
MTLAANTAAEAEAEAEECLSLAKYTEPMSPEPSRLMKWMSVRVRGVLMARMAVQQGLLEGVWGLVVVVVVEVVQVASDSELVLRLMSVVVVVLVVVELKLMLWRSSARSSSHGGSISEGE